MKLAFRTLNFGNNENPLREEERRYTKRLENYLPEPKVTLQTNTIGKLVYVTVILRLILCRMRPSYSNGILDTCQNFNYSLLSFKLF